MRNLISIIFFTALGFTIAACTKDATSKQPQYIYKAAPKDGVVAKIAGREITESEVRSGIENEIYEAQMNVFEIQMNKVRAMVLEEFMNKDPRKEGLSNDEFLDQYIAKDIKVTEKQIKDFIIERKIPDEHINDQMNERIKQYLEVELKKEAIDKWIAEKTAKEPIEIYLTKPERPTFDVKVGNAPIKGGKDAKVTIVEFSDFQCPFCAKGAAIMEEVVKKYGNKVKVAYKNYPLPFHQQARPASMAALCAGDQSEAKFWDMYKRMFDDQQGLSKSGLEEKAKASGLNMDTFKECMAEEKFAAQIDQDMKEGQDLGVKSTPTFFVNGIMVTGAQPIEAFSEIIDELLAQ